MADLLEAAAEAARRALNSLDRATFLDGTPKPPRMDPSPHLEIADIETVIGRHAVRARAEGERAGYEAGRERGAFDEAQKITVQLKAALDCASGRLTDVIAQLRLRPHAAPGGAKADIIAKRVTAGLLDDAHGIALHLRRLHEAIEP